MMQVNIKCTDSLFEKGFAKYPLILKKTLISDRFKKSFSFAIYIHFLSKKLFDILYLRGLQLRLQLPCFSKSSKQFCFGRELIWIIFYTCNPLNHTDLFARKLLRSAFKLGFPRFFISNTSLNTWIKQFSIGFCS